MGGNSAPLDDYDLIADEVGSEFDVVEPPPEPPACQRGKGSRLTHAAVSLRPDRDPLPRDPA